MADSSSIYITTNDPTSFLLGLNNIPLCNRDVDVENEHMDTSGEGECGTNRESSVAIYTLPRVKQTAGGSCSIAQRAQLGALMTYRGGAGRGRL